MAKRHINKLPRGVEAIKRAGGRVVYRGRWRDREDPNVRYSTACYDTPREAKVALEAERHTGDAKHDANGKHEGKRYRERSDVPDTIEALGEAYLAQFQGEASTIRAYRTNLRAMVTYFGAERRLVDIDRALVRQWAKSMARAGRVTGTQACRISTLRGMFEYAIVELEVLARNPCDGVEPEEPDEDDTRRVGRYPTEQEIMDTYAAMPARTAPVVFLGADSGLRRSELAALRWSHLDFEGRWVTVENMIDCEGKDRVGTKGRRRSKARGKARVPLSLRAIEALTALREAHPADETGYVFRRRDGQRYAPYTLWGHWRDARLRTMGPAARNVRLHDLRWHTATNLVRNHLSLDETRRIMRHHSPRMTDHYVADPVDVVVSASFARATDHLTAS